MPLFGNRRAPSAAQWAPPPRPGPASPRDDFTAIAAAADPAAAFRWCTSPQGPGGESWRRRMPLGGFTQGWAYTQADTHVLALGPARSHAGKTASLMIPIILTALGPVVAASTKPDIMDATAIERVHHGTLWCFAPDGETTVPYGIQEVRWSPLVRADNWDVARASARDMTAALVTQGVRGGDHWKERARSLLGPIFHWAARTGRQMEEVIATVNSPTAWGEIHRWLSDNDASLAASVLTGILHAGREELGSIVNTAARALSVYEGTGALRSAQQPNFDPEAFVRGGPTSRSDTLYIMSTDRQQQMVAPLVVALLGRIRDACYQVYRERGPGASTVFALDEMYGLAPLPELPLMLSSGGSQGLLVAGAVQDLTLIKSRWPDEAEGFLTLFGNVVIFPGIRDGTTLEAVSKLIGDWDRPVQTENLEMQGQGIGLPWDWGVKSKSSTIHRERIFPPSEINQGVEAGNPDVLLWLDQGGWAKLTATPWWRSDPWPQILAAYLSRAASGRVPEWLYFHARQTGEHPEIPDFIPQLPMPDLMAWLHQWKDDVQVPWRGGWARQLLEHVYPQLNARRTRAPEPAVYDISPTWFMPGVPWNLSDMGARAQAGKP